MTSSESTASSARPPFDAATEAVFGPIPAKEFGGHERSSRYVEMRDGTRLAADIYLPAGLGSQQVSSFLIATPYFRRLQPRGRVGAALMGRIGLGGDNRWWPELATYGYASIVVEQRGSGASFGQRAASVQQTLDDLYDLLDWLISQPFSDGQVIPIGVSAVGISAQFAASTGHPAVKAVMPMFSSFDLYTGTHPGGLALAAAVGDVMSIMRNLDHGQVHRVAPNRVLATLLRTVVRGLAPVDDDPSGQMLRRAILAHAENTYHPAISETEYRDDLPASGGEALEAQSPHAFAPRVSKGDIRVAAYGGWWDTASALEMMQVVHSTDAGHGRLVVGPWGHAAAYQVGPGFHRKKRRSSFDFPAEIARFAAGVDEPAGATTLYWTFGAEQWRRAGAWPPPAEPTKWYLGDRSLGPSVPPESRIAFEVDPKATTGAASRWGLVRHVFEGVRYPAGRGTGSAPSFTSEPLSDDLEVTGTPVLELLMSSSDPDGALVAYLLEVDGEGVASYVTEGVLRLSCRAEGPMPYDPVPGRVSRPCRRGEHRAMASGRAEAIRLDLMPVSYLFRVGRRMRIELSGGDADHLVAPASDAPPTLTVHSGGPLPSSLTLPVSARREEQP